VVRHENALPFDQNVHLHGGLVPAGSDGHPMDLIAPGGSFTYTYPSVQDAATLWYHDHATACRRARCSTGSPAST
jgi:spore coat protein A